MEIILYLVINVLLAWACFSLSQKAFPDKEEWVHWVGAALGFFFGIFAVIAYFIVYLVKNKS